MHNKPISTLYFCGVHTTQNRLRKSISGLERGNMQIVINSLTHRTKFKCLSPFKGASCLRDFTCSPSATLGQKNIFHLHDRKKKYNNEPAVILQANKRNFSTSFKLNSYNSPILTSLLNP